MALKTMDQNEKFSDTGKIQSPADKARHVMDARIGEVVKQNYNWRRIAIGLLVTCIVLSIGLTVQSLKSQIIPYVVTVDKNTGEVEKAGALIAQEYTPQEAEIRYFIGQFIQNGRNIQLDPVQQDLLQKKAYAYLTTSAAKKFQSMQINEGFREKYASVTVQVKIKGIKRITDTDSYHATWDEETFDINTGQRTVKNYEGVFAITTIPPKDDATLLANPLGLYISDLNYSAEMGQTGQNGKTTQSTQATQTTQSTQAPIASQ